MSTRHVAAEPAVLASIEASLVNASSRLPLATVPAVSIGDRAADDAISEFDACWTAHLQALNDVIRLTARQANLTALAFRLAGG